MPTILIVVIAFICGFFVKQVGLPPLVGFLAAGFVLNVMGVEANETLILLSDVGILLLLFSIGLKIQVKKLLEPKVWGTASIHMFFTTLLFGGLFFLLSVAGLSFFSELTLFSSLTLAFALSFSSTVFVVKILEERGEMNARHGRLAIGILVIQDLFAVLFITISGGKLPSPYALGLLALFFLRKPLMKIMERSGHGELLVLLACILPLAGATIFESVGLKPDLGALLLGAALAGHPKSEELGKAMYGFKDLFLVGFFLTIGLAGLPDLQILGVAVLLIILLPAKTVLFFFLLTRFRLRARTSLLTSMSLTNYSEFGLIICAISVKEEMMANEWLTILAVGLSLSMIAAAPVNSFSSNIYSRLKGVLKRFETKKRLEGDDDIDLGGADIIIFGMGRVGTGAYDNLRQRYGEMVVGVDSDEAMVDYHKARGRSVMHGDAGDDDFWQRGLVAKNRPRLVLLNMIYEANLTAAHRIRRLSDGSEILAATAQYEDEEEELHRAGVDHVFNYYAEAGAGFSDHICQMLPEQEAVISGGTR